MRARSAALFALLLTAIAPVAAAVETHLTWEGWKEVPGGLRTIAAPAARTYYGKLYLLAVGEDHKPRYDVFGGGAWNTGWSGWKEIPGEVTTDTHLGMAVMPGGVGDMLVVRKATDQHIWVDRLSTSGQWSGWNEVPGGGTTDAAVNAVQFGGALWLFSKGINDSHIYMNTAGNDAWSSWKPVPGDGTTNAALGSATYALSGPGQHAQLYLFGKGINDPRVYVNVKPHDGDFPGWSEVPGGGTTDVALAPVLFGNRLFLFSKGINDRQIYVNPIDGAKWQGAVAVPGGGTTDASVAPAAFGGPCPGKLYLFSKGIDDKRVYVNIASLDPALIASACGE